MRLIDADALKIPSTSVDMFENCRNCRLLDEEQVREIIDNAPTIDAVSVVHGEWIDRGMRVPSSWVKKCSLCGYETDTWRWCNFCPNCGAKMDGERKGE